MALLIQTIQLTTAQAVVAIVAVVVVWLTGLVLIAFRMGRFESSTTTSIETLEKGRIDSKEAIEKVESSLRSEVKDMRQNIEMRLDSLFKEVVRR